MQHILVLGLFLSLALGMVSLASLARLPEREASRGVGWLPITLLLYNLWVAAFLATAYLEDRAGASTTFSDAARLAQLGLALAWLSSHATLLNAFVPSASARGLRATHRTIALTACLLVAGWGVSSATGNREFLLPLALVVRVAVFPAALVASGLFLLRSRDSTDPAWRARFSAFGWANVALFSCLLALSMAWSRLAAIDPDLPVALDVLLELLYNAVAVLWVIGLTRWQGSASGQPRAAALNHRAPLAAPELASLFAAHGITKREAEIIELICEGKTNQEIADRLFISLTTVKDHNYVTFQKLGVRNRTELTRLVLDGGGPQPKSAS